MEAAAKPKLDCLLRTWRRHATLLSSGAWPLIVGKLDRNVGASDPRLLNKRQASLFGTVLLVHDSDGRAEKLRLRSV